MRRFPPEYRRPAAALHQRGRLPGGAFYGGLLRRSGQKPQAEARRLYEKDYLCNQKNNR